jgi:hypothetical protein
MHAEVAEAFSEISGLISEISGKHHPLTQKALPGGFTRNSIFVRLKEMFLYMLFYVAIKQHFISF